MKIDAVIKWFMPREERFHTLLEKDTQNLLRGARLFAEIANAPTLDELLLDLIPLVSGQRGVRLQQGSEEALTLLIKLMQERRCLLVLDNLETLFQERVLKGGYREGYAGYSTLIRRVAETAHQSCLLLTSREKFPELGVLTGQQAPVRVLRLGGLALLATQLGLRTSYPGQILPALLLVGAGLGVVFGCALNTATYGTGAADAGVAAALVNTNQQVGGSIGTALLNTLAASALTSYVLAHGRGPLVLAQAAVHSYVVGFWVSAAILVGSAVVCALVLPSGTLAPAADPAHPSLGPPATVTERR